MRKNLMLLAAAAIGLTASVASAADLPRKAPSYAPPAPPPFSWTGFYLGINGGAGWGTVDSTIAVSAAPFGAFPLSSHNVSGWLFGGQIGYNWQVQPWLVLGIEGDGEWTDDTGTTPCITFGVSCESKNKSMFDVTGRVGFVVDRALIYAKGGVAWLNRESTLNVLIPPTASFSTSHTRTGGLFGVGVEYAFLPNWSAKIEYNFIDTNTDSTNFAIPAGLGGGTATVGVNEKISLVKFGVNYRFGGWGGM
jgi:outer membrane immunogenic protein